MYSAFSFSVSALAVVVFPTDGVPVIRITCFIGMVWGLEGFIGFGCGFS